MNKKEIIRCSETILMAEGEICGQRCYQLKLEIDSSRFYWMCPTHGREKLLSEPLDPWEKKS